MNDCISVLPGQRAVDSAINNIHAASAALDRSSFPVTDKPYGQLQAELNSAAAGLSDASTEVVSSVRSTQHLEKASNKFGNAVGDILGVGMEMAGQTKVSCLLIHSTTLEIKSILFHPWKYAFKILLF